MKNDALISILQEEADRLMLTAARMRETAAALKRGDSPRPIGVVGGFGGGGQASGTIYAPVERPPAGGGGGVINVDASAIRSSGGGSSSPAQGGNGSSPQVAGGRGGRPHSPPVGAGTSGRNNDDLVNRIIAAASVVDVTRSNKINIRISPDRRHVTLQIFLKDEPGSWIEFDAEQLDELIRLLQANRDDLKR